MKSPCCNADISIVPSARSNSSTAVLRSICSKCRTQLVEHI